MSEDKQCWAQNRTEHIRRDGDAAVLLLPDQRLFSFVGM